MQKIRGFAYICGGVRNTTDFLNTREMNAANYQRLKFAIHVCCTLIGGVDSDNERGALRV